MMEGIEDTSTAVRPGVLSSAYLTDTIVFDWSQFAVRRPFIQVIAIAISLAIGIATGHPAAGMIAASGAMSVGFGAVHRIGNSCLAPMLFAALGMSVSNLIGMVAGHTGPGLVIFAALWGFGYGLLTEFGGGTSWVGQQWTIVLLISSAFPFTLTQALSRAGVMLGGGLLQVLITTTLLRITSSDGAGGCAPNPTPFSSAAGFARLRAIYSGNWLRSRNGLYAIRLAVTVGGAAEIYRQLSIPSGYWVPMTALLVLKPDFQQTAARSLARISGTIIGAGCATLIAVLLRPSLTTLAVLVVFFVWWCYATLNVNYAMYAVFLTSYIVFLLALSSLPEMVLVHRRTLCTVLGGALALLAHLDLLRPRLRSAVGWSSDRASVTQ